MNLRSIIFFTLSLISITSCSSSRDISETYIKNNHQEHEVGKLSSIQVYPISHGFTKDKKYIEFEGFMKGTEKFIVISVDDYLAPLSKSTDLLSKEKMQLSVLLTKQEALLFVNSVETTIAEYRKANNYNGVYHQDFAVTKDLYYSFGSYRNYGSPEYIMDLWIKGQKYSLKYVRIVKEVRRFLED